MRTCPCAASRCGGPRCLTAAAHNTRLFPTQPSSLASLPSPPLACPRPLHHLPSPPPPLPAAPRQARAGGGRRRRRRAARAGALPGRGGDPHGRDRRVSVVLCLRLKSAATPTVNHVRWTQHGHGKSRGWAACRSRQPQAARAACGCHRRLGSGPWAQRCSMRPSYSQDGAGDLQALLPRGD